MVRKQTVLEVKILQDPVPGWGHTPEEHAEWLQKHLDIMFSWCKPEVKLIRTDEVES